MGNCFVIQEKVLEVMKTDGGEAFAKPETEGGDQGSGVVRIKLVISKQDLEVKFRSGFSVDDIVSHLQNNVRLSPKHEFNGDHDDGNIGNQGWKPDLESIPEVN